MKKQRHAEAAVLNRVLYLLEEGSVEHVMQQDEQFAQYITGLYENISQKSEHLRTRVA